ncbi:ExeM/NucH family extracellular endonuclease [Catellatospora sp. KI3]|uniref:ExeM/NucH family extracellular endonuclease n=1 Tax=Catellatospora sp. KI3 TaxID=3041620 RepID=UPI0024830942|nr:ExeM/NucH family extracellular endonuclease [Catellatospora sp. KI3]MDI1462810.1 ExeM/NucH family extracellular endonuclease [Catellatospora sp. KI3]
MRLHIRRNLARFAVALLVIPGAATLTASGAAAEASSGNLVVVRVGDGSAALSSAAAPVFLDEYTAAGALVRTTALPTSVSGANRRFTVSGSATSEGALALSADGRYLTLGGYDADPGLAGVATSSTATVARVAARVDGAGTVDTTTAITDAFSGANIRGVVSDDGSRVWAVGSSGGVRLAAVGAGTTTQINSVAPTNLRAAAIADGRLYVSTGSAPTGVYAVGSGLPTTGGQTPSLVTAAPSPYGIVALDRDPAVAGVDTIYVADDSASPNGGIAKYSFNGSVWTARGNFRPSGSGARGITGSVTGATVTLFATTNAGTAQLVKVEDTAAYDAPISATAVVLQTASANTALRGVAFAPAGGGSTPTAPAITTQPQDMTITSGTATTLTAAATGTGPLTFQWYAGTSGDTSAPVGTGASYTTPALTATAAYWVRVSGPGGQVDSVTATVTVTPAAPVCTGAVTAIGAVQGTGDVSPRAGQTVTVRGTVVGDSEGPSPALRGFYLQDSGDGDAATSDGVFVFDNGANLVSLGDVVEVTGTVSEFQGQTQLTAAATGVVPCGAQNTVTPADLTLPRASAGDLEPYEGMLVRFHQTLTVTEHFQLGRFGQVVVSSGGRLRQPTADIRATDTAAVAAAQQANNLNRLIIDDADQAQNPDPIVFGRGGQPLSASNTLRGGDTVTDPVGVLTYTWAGNSASGNAYRLRPLNSLGGAASFEAGNPRPSAAPTVGGGLKVASANLLNFFNTYTGCRLGTLGAVTDCRGATSDTEYQRQLAKEVASLRFLGADVIGYMEMENDGYGTDSAVQALVNALNAADGPGTWAFVDADAATGSTDVAGTDAIKAGLLYRTAAVAPVAGATFVDVNPIFERRPVAQTFQTPAGARFTVIANHFKSKGSCPTSGPDTDQGDGQSCWNARRTQQAGELANWISTTVVPGAGDADVLIVGDLNSYAGEDPIAALEAAGFTNLVKAFHGDDAYSYAFDGQWGYLDYVLASGPAVGQVTGAGDVHHNADEPSVLDYNTDFKTAGQLASLYAPDRFRTSDHDPVLVGLDLGTAPTVAGTPPAGTVGEPYSFGFTVTGSGPVTASVAAGSLPPGVDLTVDGRLSGSPSTAGDFAFTVRVSSAYGQAELSASVHVGPGTSATVLTAQPNPVATGAGLTLTATVTAAVAPTGTVTFREGTTVIGTAALSGGTATLVTSALAGGDHAITAAYSGSADLLGSQSGPLAVAVVDPVTLDGTLPGGTVGAAYSANVSYSGGGPVTFALSGGALPPGLSLSASGVVSGTPTAGGGYTFTITVTNPVSTVARDYTVTIAAAATTTAVTSSASPSVLGAPVTFTAAVTGPAGTTPTGYVQFRVDGAAVGGPVALSGGKAVSSPIASLAVGSHQVSAAYLGDASYLASSGTATQVVRYAIRVVAPTAGGSVRGGSVVPVAFQLTDASGAPIPLLESACLLLSGRVKVSVSGAQSLAATTPVFEPITRTFGILWPTAKRPTGTATITVTVTYPDAPAQQVNTTITLS